MICVLMFTTFVVLGFIKKPKSVTTGEIGVVKDEEFNNIYLELSIDEFIDKGFTFGDSIDVAFDNGETIEDIPFLSGYYAVIPDIPTWSLPAISVYPPGKSTI